MAGLKHALICWKGEGYDKVSDKVVMLVMQILESQLKIKQVQVDELQAQTGLLKDIDPQKEEEIMQKKMRVEERSAVASFLNIMCFVNTSCCMFIIFATSFWPERTLYIEHCS